MNVEEMADQIGAELFPKAATPEASSPVDDGAGAAAVAASSPEAPAEPSPVDVPKSWGEDMRPFWAQIPKEVQNFWATREAQQQEGVDKLKPDVEFSKKLREVFTPYQQTLKTLGIDEARAVQELLGADHLLRYSPAEKKREYLQHLAKTYGIDLAPSAQPETPAAPVDPTVKALQDKVTAFEQQFMSRQQQEQQERAAKVQQEVEAFAADPAHAHFTECADDIVRLVQSGLSLKDAYDKAVWANPTTRSKEQQRLLQEHEAKLKENARLDALPKQQAKAVNVKSKDSGRTPQEPVGSMDETISETLKAIKSRVA